jgi:adenylate cyclase
VDLETSKAPPSTPDTDVAPPADTGQAAPTVKERAARFRQALRRTDANPALVRAMRATREFLPGDEKFGDELSTAEGRPAQIMARHLNEAGAKQQSATREAGLTALQLWQALSEAAGRGAGQQGVAILFTDLVGFSSWVLEVGDEVALELLRQVARAVEPVIRDRNGRLVKRLGDGHMAVFPNAQAAVDAALEIQERIAAVEVAGHRPQLRAGIHVGHPRKLGGDYLGTDVNIAARVGDAAEGGEVLVSDAVLAAIDDANLEVKRRRRFRAKGAPRELEVFSVRRR